MKKLFIISALIIASLCSCIKGSKLVILAAEEDEYNKCREQQHRNRHGVPGEEIQLKINKKYDRKD